MSIIFYSLFFILNCLSLSFASTYCSFDIWLDTGIDAIDISISAEGELYLIGSDSRIYHYDMLSNTYSLLHSDNEVPSPKRIAVSPEGSPYVISYNGDIYFLSVHNLWIQLPGCASDIGVGRNGDVWITNCEQQVSGGYGISKLSCNDHITTTSNTVINTEKEYVSYLINLEDDVMSDIIGNNNNKEMNDNKCYWVNIEGEGIRIAVGVHGEAYIIAPGGVVMKYDGNKWMGIYGQAAMDLDISNEGVLFTVGVDGSVMRSVVEEMGTWTQIEDNIGGMSIAVGPYSLPTVSRFMDGRVYTSINRAIHT